MATTKAERTELVGIVRMRAKLAKADIDARRSALLADVEQQLASQYEFGDERWAEITAAAQLAVQEADARVAEACRAAGIPPTFRPGLSLSWYGRGENAVAGRRAELRRVAVTRLEAMAEAAKLEVARAETELRTELAAAGLDNDEAKAWLERLPRAEQLMPTIALAEIESEHERRLAARRALRA